MHLLLITKIKSHISAQKKCNNYEFAQILVAPIRLTTGKRRIYSIFKSRLHNLFRTKIQSHISEQKKCNYFQFGSNCFKSCTMVAPRPQVDYWGKKDDGTLPFLIGPVCIQKSLYIIHAVGYLYQSVDFLRSHLIMNAPLVSWTSPVIRI